MSRSINLLRRLSWFLPRSLLVFYLKSYILPSFDYCDVVWNSCTKKESESLQTLLNFASRISLHRDHYYSTNAMRKELQLSTLHVRRKLHLSPTMFKCLSSKAPSYLSTLFQTPHCHNTRSCCLLNLPSVRRPSASLLSLFGDHYLLQCVRMNPYLPFQHLPLIFSTIMYEKVLLFYRTSLINYIILNTISHAVLLFLFLD